MVKRTFRERLLSAFYPEHCCCCGKAVACGTVVCESCRKELRRVAPPLCRLCGMSESDCYCGKRRRHMERCIFPFYYEGAAKSAIMRLKFYKKPASAEVFTRTMAEIVKREYAGIPFDCIVPVPVGASTLKSRGYNQSGILAKGISELLGIPVKEALVKLRQTEPQRSLPAYRRSGNVLGVFDVNANIPLNNKTILLVDDIVTTGSTLDECAKIMKIYGAQEVYVVTAAASRLQKSE